MTATDGPVDRATGAWQGFVDVPGGRLWAEAAGAGPSVVLVHAGIADARMWDPQWAELAARHRVVRYDCRGFGRSESGDVAFSNRADLIAVMDAAGLAHATLVGCSRAGAIVVDTALEFPGRVAGLVSVCGGLGGLEMEDTPEEREVYERGEVLEAAKDWAAAADLDVALWVDGVGQPTGRAPAAVRELVRRMTFETYAQEKPVGRPTSLSPPAATRLHEIAVPTLVIIGELDTLSTRLTAEVLATGIRAAERVPVPGVAHLPNLERPEWFTRTLLEFLSRIG
jgi:3-oxoadipate enol-lactonase